VAARKKKAAKRSSRRPAAVDVVDVTDESADAVVGKIKLLCDNDTEVVFARIEARLIMRLQGREETP
jgi:hypothetical protein